MFILNCFREGKTTFDNETSNIVPMSDEHFTLKPELFLAVVFFFFFFFFTYRYVFICHATPHKAFNRLPMREPFKVNALTKRLARFMCDNGDSLHGTILKALVLFSAFCLNSHKPKCEMFCG